LPGFLRGLTLKFTGGAGRSYEQRCDVLQRHYRGTWHNVTTKRLSSSSKTSFKLPPQSIGTTSYRVFKPKEAHRVAGWSRIMKIRVR
jgi:hypothetical protein